MIKLDFVDRSAVNREANFLRAQEERVSQADGADHFLRTGLTTEWYLPPYGKEWDRDYNPNPYTDARPDAEMYDGTGVGFLYGLDSRVSDVHRRMFATDLAGWNLVREGVEEHRTSTKVDKKELSPQKRHRDLVERDLHDSRS